MKKRNWNCIRMVNFSKQRQLTHSFYGPFLFISNISLVLESILRGLPNLTIDEYSWVNNPLHRVKSTQKALKTFFPFCTIRHICTKEFNLWWKCRNSQKKEHCGRPKQCGNEEKMETDRLCDSILYRYDENIPWLCSVVKVNNTRPCNG